MEFKGLLLAAKSGNEAAITEICRLYRPLLMKNSMIEGVFDEDLYQELLITLTVCIKHFCLT